jgi:hypothetical protein
MKNNIALFFRFKNRINARRAEQRLEKWEDGQEAILKHGTGHTLLNTITETSAMLILQSTPNRLWHPSLG